MADNGDFAEQVKKFKEDVKHDAEVLVLNTFPQKTLELNNFLQSSRLSVKNLEKIKAEVNIPIPVVEPNCDSDDGLPSKKRKLTNNCDGDGDSKNLPGSRVYILPNGSVPCNKFIVELIDEVKPLIRQLVEDSNLLKMWILFLIPRIEDGNNFGVSIQEDTLNEIRTVEGEAAAYFDQVTTYFLSRAKIVTKIAKYPHVSDFRQYVSEIDEKQFLSLRLTVAELRNHYASLHDIVIKNLEKIKRPRTSNHGSMF